MAKSGKKNKKALKKGKGQEETPASQPENPVEADEQQLAAATPLEETPASQPEIPVEADEQQLAAATPLEETPASQPEVPVKADEQLATATPPEETPAFQPEIPVEADKQQLAASTPLPETEEVSELPTAPAQDESQSAPEAVSEAAPVGEVPDLPEVPATNEPLPAPEVATEPASEPVPVTETAPEEEPTAEPTEHIEQSQTPFDFETPVQQPVGNDSLTQDTKLDTPSDQPSELVDTTPQEPKEPSQEDFGAWEQLDASEAKKDHDEIPTQENNRAPSEQTLFTAPQSPETVTGPSDSWPAWEESDFAKTSNAQDEAEQLKGTPDFFESFTNPFAAPVSTDPAAALEEEQEQGPVMISKPVEEPEIIQEANPTKNDAEDPQTPTNPFADSAAIEPESAPAQEPVQEFVHVDEPQTIEKQGDIPEEARSSQNDTDMPHALSETLVEPASEQPLSAPESKALPVDETHPVQESKPVQEAEPEKVPEVVTVPDVTNEHKEAEPELTAVEPPMAPEQAIEAAKEVTPPASKPQSPAPETASPSFKSASPMLRAVSPSAASVADTVDGQHMYPPIPPPAAPTPPVTSLRTQDVPPMKDAIFSARRAAPPTPPSASPHSQTSHPMDQGFSPRQKSASTSYKQPSPVRKPSSPPKVSSPLAHNYASPVMSPRTASMPPMPPTFPPSVPPSYASTYQSPPMSSAGYYPPHYAYYQPTSHPQPMTRGSMPPNGGGPFPGMPDLSYLNGHDRSGRRPGFPTDQDDAQHYLERIQDAIPDINRLLGSFKHTKTQLHSREVEFKQMESQHKQAMMHKDFFIEALQNQLRKAANESAEEATKHKNMINELRLELGNMDEKLRDLEERLGESEVSVGKVKKEKAELEDQVKQRDQKLEEEQVAHKQELEKQHAEHETDKEEALTVQKQELTELFEEIRAEDEKSAAEALAAREIELQNQQDAMKKEYEQQKEQMEEELKDTRQAHAEQVESLEKSHQEKVTEMERAWNEEKTGLETQLAAKAEELANSEKENKRLEDNVLSREKQLNQSVDTMRTTIENLDNDCDRLKKTLHSLGEATDLKNTKGDTFFLDCFDQLQRLIVTLSKEHFSYLPIDPPQEVLSKLPPDLPSFLDNTPASRELRAAYVQHIVSKTITYRIFHPFLFTLGRRYDKADILFQMLSMDIRRKSVRREAFWRQQTLKAAYTTSDAKESINVVAAVIVDEISNQLKHFADPRRMDGFLTGIRKIVKLAAETWRHARVERELILASLPAPEDGNIASEDWEEYGLQEGEEGSPPIRHVLLRPFPRIVREAAHEDFVGDEGKANPCTYSRGAVLYSDSPVVVARLQELARRSSDALAGDNGDAGRRASRASAASELPALGFQEIPDLSISQDTLIDGATGANLTF